MGDYMRFIIDDDKDITLDAINAGLKSIDPKFNFAEWDRECECAELLYGDDLYGEIEIIRIDQVDKDEEIEELVEEVKDAVQGDKKRVLTCLRNSKAMLLIHVLWQARDTDATLETISPLWNWLFDNYQGMLQADGEGYYDQENQILQTE